MLVRRAMTTDPVTATLSTPAVEAARLLAEHATACLPVVDGGGRLRGVVGDRDLARVADPDLPCDAGDAGGPDAPAGGGPPASAVRDRTVGDLCVAPPATLSPDDDVAVAIAVMTATGTHTLPVTERGHRLVGVLSRGDVLRALSRTDAAVAADVRRLLATVGHADWGVDSDRGTVVVTGPRGTGEEALARLVAETVAGVLEVRSVPTAAGPGHRRP